MTRFICLAAVVGLAVGVAAQTAARVRIISPEPGAMLAGAVTLRASVEPADHSTEVTRLTFFVDGREACSAAVAPFECEWHAGRDVGVHVVRVVAVMRDGTRLSASVRTRGLSYADKVDVDAIQITVVVTDEAGRFVPRLPRSAFRVLEDDVPQTISTFGSDDVPLELIAALDVSQSMTDAMSSLKEAASGFLGALRGHERVTLLAFNDNIFTLARRTTTNEAKLRAVDRLAPWGGTALYDVIIKGVDLLQRQPGRRALMLFSDGEDQSSRADVASALRSVEASDATVYTVGLGRALKVRSLHDLLERLSTLSGGRALFAESGEALTEAFGAIVEDLSHQYLVGYQPRNQKRDGAWRRIKVQVDGAHTVRHRQGYRLMPEGRS